MKCCIWSMGLCGAGTWTLRKVDEKYLESFEMWCWRRMLKGRLIGLVESCVGSPFKRPLLKDR